MYALTAVDVEAEHRQVVVQLRVAAKRLGGLLGDSLDFQFWTVIEAEGQLCIRAHGEQTPFVKLRRVAIDRC